MITSSTTVRRFTVLSFLTLFGLLLSLPSFAGTQLWDFEKNADGWKVANGTWAVADGVYKLSKGGPAEHSLVGEADWDDYTVEAKIRVDAGSWAGLAFRAKSEMEYYVYYFNVPDNKTELWRHQQGGWGSRHNLDQIPAVGGVKIKIGDWIDMKVEVEGNTFKLYINDKFQRENKDDLYETGQVGLWGWETAASFDDFTVSGTNIKDTLAVDPNRKLTTTWGSLKEIR